MGRGGRVCGEFEERRHIVRRRPGGGRIPDLLTKDYRGVTTRFKSSRLSHSIISSLPSTSSSFLTFFRLAIPHPPSSSSAWRVFQPALILAMVGSSAGLATLLEVVKDSGIETSLYANVAREQFGRRISYWYTAAFFALLVMQVFGGKKKRGGGQHMKGQIGASRLGAVALLKTSHAQTNLCRRWMPAI